MREDKKNRDFEENEKIAEIEDEDVEGYSYCASSRQKCMTDCDGTPIMSTLV